MEQLIELAGAPDKEAATGDALLAAVLARLAGHARRAQRDAGLHPGLALAERLIRSRLASSLDVAALAVEVGLSHSHLGSLFRARYDCSPSQWHLRLRLERARILLANPYASVSAVASELGFTDLNYFVRRFRVAHGRPPGRWRRHSG
jgi:AraC-like DNA-binding protein